MNAYPQIYGCYNTDTTIRQRSSSGGIFYPIANLVIENGGVIFGAMFDNNYEVVHSYCEDLDGIMKFMGSKYVQSSIGTSYIEAKKFLDTGRQVLFTGSPCQIAGLKSFLKKEYSKLITIDFICHGVPSRKIWRFYKNTHLAGKQIKGVNFRDKSEGWKNSSLSIQFGNGEEYLKSLKKELYMQGFLNNLYLRPSCYECHFKKVQHLADITIGDFWAVETIFPEQNDDKGISLVMIQSEQGKEIFDNIQSKLCIIGTPTVEFVMKKNSAIIRSATKTKKRTEFYENYEKNFRKTVKRLTQRSILNRVCSKLKYCLRKTQQ